ncbi:MAG: VanW family protein [Chloroflexota bacterium]
MTSIPVQKNPYPASSPTFNPWLLRLPILLITGFTLLLLLLVILIGVFRISYTERITPGVTVFGVDLGGMTRESAINTLAGRFSYDDSAVYTFRHGDDAWQFTAGELGLTFDTAATVDEALAVGAGDNFIGGLLNQADAWFSGQAIAPIIKYDQNMAVERLMRIAEVINRPPQDAALVINGTSVSTTPGQTGYTLDITTTLQTLNERMLTLDGGGEIPLVINETPPLVWNVDEVADQVRAAFSGPLQLTATDSAGNALGPWTISVEQIAALLRIDMVDNADGTRRYVPTIDMSVFADTLAQLAPGLTTQPVDGRFHFDDPTGQLIMVQPAVPGRALDIEATLARLEDAVYRYDSRTVSMAFDLTQPRYHEGITAAELGITQMVAESTTYFDGSSANRRHNIAEGASRFDGIIIGPGDEFSFNQHLGDISLESGFVEGKVIVGGSTVTGIGGGICQVSTTAFRAALNGGYWISERNTHAYRVSYYELADAPPGLDAAIWSPERDFKFINDTDYHLLIEVSVYPSQNALQFRLYSTDPGRSVEFRAPVIQNEIPAPPPRYVVNPDLRPGEVVQVDYAADGMDVTIVRLVTDVNGETRTDRVFTHYLPWQAVYEVAPGDPRLAQNSGSTG